MKSGGVLSVLGSRRCRTAERRRRRVCPTAAQAQGGLFLGWHDDEIPEEGFLSLEQYRPQRRANPFYVSVACDDSKVTGRGRIALQTADVVLPDSEPVGGVNDLHRVDSRDFTTAVTAALLEPGVDKQHLPFPEYVNAGTRPGTGTPVRKRSVSQGPQRPADSRDLPRSDDRVQVHLHRHPFTAGRPKMDPQVMGVFAPQDRMNPLMTAATSFSLRKRLKRAPIMVSRLNPVSLAAPDGTSISRPCRSKLHSRSVLLPPAPFRCCIVWVRPAPAIGSAFIRNRETTYRPHKPEEQSQTETHCRQKRAFLVIHDGGFDPAIDLSCGIQNEQRESIEQ